MESKFFAGFIITYNRPDILKGSIEKIFAQTFPPEKIWIIDNSEGSDTKDLIQSLDHYPLAYINMGYNAGPAGAAAKGLELVAADGYDWIYWGDDDDPPFRSDCFERLLYIKDKVSKTGVLGTVGHFFDINRGLVKRTSNKQLHQDKFLKVDFVAGGMCMLVSGEVARKGVLPDPNLFFGFEELDFCLKVKQQGFEVIVDSSLFLQARELHQKLDYKQPKYIRKDSLSREYYSLRNLLMIANSLNSSQMKFRLILRWSLKLIYGFRFGFSYGLKNFKMITLAFYHYVTGKSGKTIDL